MARQTGSDVEAKDAQPKTVAIVDVLGKTVEIPIDAIYNAVRDQRVSEGNRATPRRDAQGRIPEFVNVSRKFMQICVAGQPMDTIRVPHFGVLRGEQWRHFCEPGRAWGDYPPFLERVRDSKGELDPTYLLTEEQVAMSVARVKSWEYGIPLLQLYRRHGKIQKRDKTGRPTVKDTSEDRPKALAAIGERTMALQAAREEMQRKAGQVG